MSRPSDAVRDVSAVDVSAAVPAPVPTPVVAVAPMASVAVIALGSNQGDREQLLRDAVKAIDALDDVRVTAASGIVETPALKLDGVDEEAPSYLNAVVLAQVAVQPAEFLQQLHGIEANLGRVRTEVWGDRTVDLDLIDFGGLTCHDDAVTLPHPRAWQRAFVLAPWLQVQPDAVLAARTDAGTWAETTAPATAPAPKTGGRIADLLSATTDRVTEYPARALMEVLER